MNSATSEATEIGTHDGKCYGAAVKREGVDTSARFFFHEAAMSSWKTAPVRSFTYATRSAYVDAFKAAAVKAAI